MWERSAQAQHRYPVNTQVARHHSIFVSLLLRCTSKGSYQGDRVRAVGLELLLPCHQRRQELRGELPQGLQPVRAELPHGRPSARADGPATLPEQHRDGDRGAVHPRVPGLRQPPQMPGRGVALADPGLAAQGAPARLCHAVPPLRQAH